MTDMRRKDREITESNDILKIVDEAKILHLGLFDVDYPYIVPLHYGYEYKDEQLIFYIHSAKEGHKIDLLKENPHVCLELNCDVDMISGGDIPCTYGSEYSSVIARGNAELLEEPSEKIRGLKALMTNQTHQEFEIDERMASAVEVIRITSRSFTAKTCRKPKA